MKRVVTVLGIVVITALVGLSMAACDKLIDFSPPYFTDPSQFVFDAETGTIIGFLGPSTDVVILYFMRGASVTAIGPSAFADGSLTSVILPSSIVSIGESAFENNKLTSVTLRGGVASIGARAFASNRLTSVDIPLRTGAIESSAFADNLLAGVVNIPLRASVADDAFDPEVRPVRVEFGFVRYGAGYAITDFGGMPGEARIPAAHNSLPVVRIGDTALRDSQLTDVTIPDSVASIGNSAFRDNQLISITIPNSVTSIEGLAFANNQLSSVTIGNGVTRIGIRAFANNRLSSVVIPESVVSIDSWAFTDNQLASVFIPDSVIRIGGSAFFGNRLTSVTIPSSVTSIGSGAFDGNPQLAEINVAPGNPNFSSTSGVLYNWSSPDFLDSELSC
ncbi:MAG: leucine-rich repeat domain-containing protein [Treponema sp.]|nr:leucine-rich repeat domain-containing protein [Treponema sp.]